MNSNMAEKLYKLIPKEDRGDWIELLDDSSSLNDEDLEKVLSMCKADESDKLYEYAKALSLGITGEELEVMLQDDFTAEQLKEIRLGFEANLKLSDVVIYSKESLSRNVMEIARKHLEKGVDTEKVAIFINHANDICTAIQLSAAIEDGLSLETITFLANRLYDPDQIKELRLAFKGGLSTETVSIFSNPKFEASQMATLRDAILIQNIPEEYVACIAKISFNCSQISQAIEIIKKHEISLEELKNIISINPSYQQLYLIKVAYENIVDNQVIALLYSESFSSEKSASIQQAIQKGYSYVVIRYLAMLEDDSVETFNNIIFALLNCDSLSLEQIKFIASYKIPKHRNISSELLAIINAFKFGMTDEELTIALKDSSNLSEYIYEKFGEKLLEKLNK